MVWWKSHLLKLYCSNMSSFHGDLIGTPVTLCFSYEYGRQKGGKEIKHVDEILYNNFYSVV